MQNHNTHVAIGEIIRNARESVSVSQGRLAEMIGSTQATISRLERLDGDVKLSTLARIAKSLNCRLVVRFCKNKRAYRLGNA